jgi:hypothetical protein
VPLLLQQCDCASSFVNLCEQGDEFQRFLSTLPKLRKVTVSFVVSVCLPSVRMEQLDFHLKDFH